jgi:hypothetical protein
MAKVVPVLQALLLAEKVWKTADGQHIIAGTFNSVNLIKKASLSRTIEAEDGQKIRIMRGGQSGAPYAYLSLTDVCDDTILLLQFVSLRLNKVFFQTGVKIASKDRLATVEIVVALPLLELPGPGIYSFEVICEGELIGSHRIVAKEQTLNEDE